MRSFELKIGSALLAVSLAAVTGYAQTSGGDSSVAALQPVVRPLSVGNAPSTNPSSQSQSWNEGVLTGAQELSPEAQAPTRSYWQPFFNLTSTLDTNPLGLGNSLSLVPWASFYGGIDLHARSRRSDLSLSYLGGGVVSQDRNEDAPIQQLSFVERLNWRRAAISLIDQFGFFPEAVSEMNLPTALNDPSATNGPLLQPAFLPNQFIASTMGQDLTNSAVGELDVSVSRHSSLSVLGSSSIVRYFNDNLLDLNDVVLQAGFNRQLTQNNTVALLYRFTAFRFNNVYQPMNGHAVQATFGRRVTDRLAFQLAGGPELAEFGLVTVQATSPSNFAVTQLQRIYATADVSATYRSGRALLRFGYDRGMTDGAGFLAGAITDAGYGSIERQVSRHLIGQLTGGYAKNRGLVATAQQQTLNQIYTDWYGGATVSHGWGRWTSIFLSYQVQRQAANFTCVGVVCGNGFTRHLISIGLTKRLQPRLIG